MALVPYDPQITTLEIVSLSTSNADSAIPEKKALHEEVSQISAHEESTLQQEQISEPEKNQFASVTLSVQQLST